MRNILYPREPRIKKQQTDESSTQSSESIVLSNFSKFRVNGKNSNIEGGISIVPFSIMGNPSFFLRSEDKTMGYIFAGDKKDLEESEIENTNEIKKYGKIIYYKFSTLETFDLSTEISTLESTFFSYNMSNFGISINQSSCFLFGGWLSYFRISSDLIYKYSTFAKTILTIQKRLSNKKFFVSASNNISRTYIFGGINILLKEENYSDVIERFDFLDENLRTISRKISEKKILTHSNKGNDISSYLVGGFNGEKCFDSIDVFNYSGETIEKISNVTPANIFDYCTSGLRNSQFIFGGRRGIRAQFISKNIYRLQYSNRTLEQIGFMLEGTTGSTCVNNAGKTFVCGGRTKGLLEGTRSISFFSNSTFEFVQKYCILSRSRSELSGISEYTYDVVI